MNCSEFREIMRSLIDGSVDGKTRKQAMLHCTDCSECSVLVEDDSFWDESINSYLNHKLPDGLRESILGDLAHVNTGVAQGAGVGHSIDLNKMGWRQQMRIVWWAVRKDINKPMELLKVAVVVLIAILVLLYLPTLFSSN